MPAVLPLLRLTRFGGNRNRHDPLDPPSPVKRESGERAARSRGRPPMKEDAPVGGCQKEKRTLPRTPSGFPRLGCVAANESPSRSRNVDLVPFRSEAECLE